jgi:Na+-transporting NADH:ubiquinone oxidoreductase subunit C
MFLLTLFFTGVVSGINIINEKRIKLNEKVKLQKVILTVLTIKAVPVAIDSEVANLFETRVKIDEKDGMQFYRGFAEDGKTLVGYAFPLYGPGFWGPIYGMIAVDSRLESVLNIAFYRHSETPGLGGRITEDWFRSQFRNKRLSLDKQDQSYFRFRPQGTARADNEVDAITGATGTSKAVERIINNNLKNYLQLFAGEESREPAA